MHLPPLIVRDLLPQHLLVGLLDNLPLEQFLLQLLFLSLLCLCLQIVSKLTLLQICQQLLLEFEVFVGKGGFGE